MSLGGGDMRLGMDLRGQKVPIGGKDRMDLRGGSNSPMMLIQEGGRRRCARKDGVDKRPEELAN